MRVFIYEYVCGGGLTGRPMPDSLAREGWAMLASIVEDFALVEGCEVVATIDERLANRPLAAHRVEAIGPGGESAAIDRLAGASDYTLLIAPEFDGILLARTRRVGEAGGRLLGSSLDAVRMTGDKLSCSRRLHECGVPVVVGESIRVGESANGESAGQFPAVLKPRDGAGSQDTFFVDDAAELETLLQRLATDRANCGREFLRQPFVAGLPASVSFLVGPLGSMPLLCGEQLLSADGCFRYRGGRMPLDADVSNRAVSLASRAIAAFPGLGGFVGVDLVLGPDVVIEINPRPTTSYVGLRKLAIDNLAEVWLRRVQGIDPAPVRWRPGTVCFRADGTIA